ncbi:hypothetical protein AGDE_02545 [Angomonas deanei]|uniref:Uncharacterized protein n=1 Tax=Angomonas deanei TaxID=59799 RepID=A0A7G2CHM2_9TRYP|nr:hypothetical protein AGDE_02545 [Angomonas deanei]CAD2218919.1 hypothetical protein, conserved [Angomonas deanei]|eukprot:EPY41379.1 hypothetical protein AGDE_02545 [Angomonas deanei]
MSAPLPKYHNDGTGRDTFINHAGTYWTNPMPGGEFYTSVDNKFEPKEEDGFDATRSVGQQRHPARTLYGKSRYGTTVLKSTDKVEGDAKDGDPNALTDSNGGNGPVVLASSEGAPFDPEATALDTIPNQIPNPEQRLNHPGHAREVPPETGGSNYTGTPEPWTAPKAVDNTLLRLAPTYESSTHHALRTGQHYNEDEAPPHENTLPEKGTNWGKSRYYP